MLLSPCPARKRQGGPATRLGRCNAPLLGRPQSPRPHAAGGPSSLPLQAWLSPSCRHGVPARRPCDREGPVTAARGGGQGLRSPEGQRVGPRVADGKGSSPVITNSGCLRKSNLRVSAGAAPPPPSALRSPRRGEELAARSPGWPRRSACARAAPHRALPDPISAAAGSRPPALSPVDSWGPPRRGRVRTCPCPWG